MLLKTWGAAFKDEPMPGGFKTNMGRAREEKDAVPGPKGRWGKEEEEDDEGVDEDEDEEEVEAGELLEVEVD